MPPVRTTCPYCGVGCGVVAERHDQAVAIRGDGDHPSSLGALCSKGVALADTLGLEGRLLHPEIHGRRTGWNAALDQVASRLRDTFATHGPDAVAFYLSGQLLTEDYYVANKLMKGFLGSANIDTNSRLCMSSSVVGHQRAFGADLVPTCYADLDEADLVVLVGSNAAWCHPVLFQRLRAAKRTDPDRKLVVVDPRRTPTCELADLHLPLQPGTDAVLWNGLLTFLVARGLVDWRFLEMHTRGFGEALGEARQARDSVTRVAAACGLADQDVALFFEWFARTERSVTCYSQGIHQTSSGTDKVNAILNCHLATGRIGRPGAGPLSLPGQPNAMGGREVGGLATALAAHMGFEAAAIDRVSRFWNAPRMATRPGLRAVEMFDAVHDGRVRAIWIAGTNPAVSLPHADRATEALRRCPFVVVSDCVADNDTLRLAHVKLPALAWGEKDGTVTNSERRISRQRAFLPAPGEARADFVVFADVARRLGFAGFDYRRPAEVFREHAALSAFENGGTRLFDLGALATLTDGEYEALEPVQWPVPVGRRAGTARLFGDGGFQTEDGRARLIALCPRGPAHPPGGTFPLSLNTGRVRDQWHTMTRTGRSARLSAHCPEPYLEMHPGDARAHGMADGDLARVESAWGSATLRVRVQATQRSGSVFAPIHWSTVNASQARIGAVVNPVVDPCSGQPESKHTPVRVVPVRPAWQGFAFLRDDREVGRSPASYWTRATGDGHVAYTLAGDTAPPDWSAWARFVLGAPSETPLMEMHDPARGRYRALRLEGDRLVGCLFVGRHADTPPRELLTALFGADDGGADPDWFALLAGRSLRADETPGALVCACKGVGAGAIRRAIRRGQLGTIEEVAQATNAGTGCGSCLSELHALLAEMAAG